MTLTDICTQILDPKYVAWLMHFNASYTHYTRDTVFKREICIKFDISKCHGVFIGFANFDN